MELSVVIPTYNRYNDLKECLNSLFDMRHLPYEVIIVDSSSTDGTADLAKRFHVKYLSIPERSRVKARNLGCRRAAGDIIAYIDDDTVVQEDWSTHLLESYEDERIGGVGGRVLPYGVNKASFVPLKNYDVGKVFDDGVVLGNFDLPISRLIEVDTFIGCNMSFRRELLMKIGGFDENFKSNCFREESDICTRLKKAGNKLVYNSKALVWHKWGKYKRGFMDYKWFYWTAYNHSYFYFKNFQPITMKKILKFFYRTLYPYLDYAKRIGVEIKIHPLIMPPVLLGIFSGMFNASKVTQKQYSLFSPPSYWTEPKLRVPSVKNK